MNNLISNASVLIVDDTPLNIDILVSSLSENYNIQVALGGKEAIEAVAEQLPDLILLDIMMPDIDGFEVCRRLKNNTNTKDIPVIFLTALSEIDKKAQGFELGAVDYITKPFNPAEVNLRVETHLSLKFAKDLLKDKNKILEILVNKKTRQIQNTQDVTIRMAASLAETRDNETGMHIIRTQHYVEILAVNMCELPAFADQLTEDIIQLLVKSAPLHDIGKIGVADNILLKPGKLEPEEFKEMKKHTFYGERALIQAEKQLEGESFLQFAREIAVSHHEKWDGSGYPAGLSGIAIPLSGRIMAVADVYDALISKRVYKPPFTHTKAAAIIKEGAGSHFDPDIVEAFEKTEEKFREIAKTYAESDEEREAIEN